MKKGKAVWIMIFLGILLVLSCVILGGAIVEECSRSSGNYSMGKVLVSVKNHIDRQGVNCFSIEDIDKLEKKLLTEDISYTVQSGLMGTAVSNGISNLTVRLTGADHAYTKFNGLTLEEGSFITQKQQKEGAMVAVIDDELAWEMFKSVDVTGETLHIYGSAFRIIGVAKKDDTIIGKLTDDGLPDVYIPAAVMLELDATARIEALQIKTDHGGILDQNVDKVRAALGEIGKKPSNYNIKDYNLKLALMEQMPLLLVFAMGIGAIFTLLVHTKNIIGKLFVLIKDEARKAYFSNVIRGNARIMGSYMLEMAVSLAGIVLIWRGISFSLYIPPQYIPDELINVSYYGSLLEGLIQGGVQNLGYVAPRSELVVNTAHTLLNLLFIISTILGFLLLYGGFRELKALSGDTRVLTVIFGLFYIFSLVALTAAVFFAGLPLILNAKSILIAWSFIFLKVLFAKRAHLVKS